MPNTQAETVTLDPTSLKAVFKQRCAESNNVFQNWQIRVHRSLSWLKRAREIPDDQPDLKFVLLWVSLNSLYSRWDTQQNAPAQDAAARTMFIERVCSWDDATVRAMLQQHRPLIKTLLENFYLSNVFWRDPSHPKAKGWGTEDANFLDRNLKEDRICRVLEQACDRLFVMRGQLVHGAATGGGKLNRQTLKHCLMLLDRVVPTLLQIVIERGRSDDWPELCYPPLNQT